jgi:hypothetical protein
MRAAPSLAVFCQQTTVKTKADENKIFSFERNLRMCRVAIKS